MKRVLKLGVVAIGVSVLCSASALRADEVAQARTVGLPLEITDPYRPPMGIVPQQPKSFTCTSQPSAENDTGYTVKFTQTRDQAGTKQYTVNVTESTIAGPQTVIKDRVVTEKQPEKGRRGAPVTYAGDNFRLSVNYVLAPREDRKHLGGLDATTDSGNQITDTVLCD